MPLIGNRSVLNKSPGRFLNAGVATLRSTFNKHGMQRNAYEVFDDKSAIPVGHLAPSAWVLPKTAGGMSSINSAGIVLTPVALAVGGITTTAEATITITIADADGQLISSGEGTASLSILSNTPLLTASIGGIGEATFTITTNTPLLGAIADGYGGALLTMSGTLTPYAVGSMSGTTEEAGLTNAGIANSVWGKVIEAGFSADQILRLLAAHAAGSATGLEGANPQFTGLDGLTLRIDGAYSAGTRTIDALNGD